VYTVAACIFSKRHSRYIIPPAPAPAQTHESCIPKPFAYQAANSRQCNSITRCSNQYKMITGSTRFVHLYAIPEYENGYPGRMVAAKLLRPVLFLIYSEDNGIIAATIIIREILKMDPKKTCYPAGSTGSSNRSLLTNGSWLRPPAHHW
jgi:hypothetical protein